MINLIEKFLEESEKMRVYLTVDKRNNDFQEVYFFLGKDTALCISKQDNKVLYQIKLSQVQINIINATEFSFTISGQVIFFLQNSNTIDNRHNPERNTKDNVFGKNQKNNQDEINEKRINVKYKFKEICEKCHSKKCTQYDTINGRKFKFGDGHISEDMLSQYDKYCETKIIKLHCADIPQE